MMILILVFCKQYSRIVDEDRTVTQHHDDERLSSLNQSLIDKETLSTEYS